MKPIQQPRERPERFCGAISLICVHLCLSVDYPQALRCAHLLPDEERRSSRDEADHDRGVVQTENSANNEGSYPRQLQILSDGVR